MKKHYYLKLIMPLMQVLYGDNLYCTIELIKFVCDKLTSSNFSNREDNTSSITMQSIKTFNTTCLTKLDRKKVTHAA